MADGDHQSAAVVVDAAPSRFESVLLGCSSRLEKLRARYLITVVQIENSVENGVAIFNFNDWTVWKYPLHAGDKHSPFVSTMEIVAHEKPAPQEVVPHLFCLVVGQVP